MTFLHSEFSERSRVNFVFIALDIFPGNKMIISTVCFILTFAVCSSVRKEPKLNFYRIRDETDNGGKCP